MQCCHGPCCGCLQLDFQKVLLDDQAGGVFFDFDFVSFGTESDISDISDIPVASLCLCVQGLIRQTSMNKMARRKESNL